MGAIFGFLGGFYANSAVVALLMAFGGGLFGALIYAFLTVTLKANQNVTGLTLTIFGTGLANLIGENLLAGGARSAAFTEGLKAAFGSIRIPVLADIPYVGPLLFNNNIFVIIGVVCAVAMGLLLKPHPPRPQPARGGREPRRGGRGRRQCHAVQVRAHPPGRRHLRPGRRLRLLRHLQRRLGAELRQTAWAGSPWRWSSSPPGAPTAPSSAR